MALTVGQTARLARVSVRTLHHYDEIGLLAPSERSEAGYRLYTEADLEKLWHVLFYRELGFPLDDIGRVMRDPSYDRRGALLAQRNLLEERALRTMSMVDAIDDAIDAIEEGSTMDKEEMFEVFGDFDPSEHEAEARARWGDTDAYKESARRTARYGKAEWEQIKAEGEEIESRLASLLESGNSPESPEAMDAVEAHRQHMSRWFYPVGHEMHVALGEMYVADPRFAEHYDKRAPGLAAFVRAAIVANAARATD